MDFGVLSLDGGGFASNSSGSDPETKQRMYGLSSSGSDNQERSVSNDDWRSLKVAKSDGFSGLNSNKSMFLQQNQNPQQMLNFASPKSDALFYHRNAGYNCGNWNNGSVIGLRGPFTPSQWMELEHQALIYKYINSNVPIPSNLLIPIKKALDSALFSTFSGLPFMPNTLGWGSFHLGFSNSTDPEPGRCRRTDGKKWRCSRDAVADQKYCERHINRGRHRSRKPVEAQSGQAIASTTAITKVVPIASASLGCGRGTAHGLVTAQHQQVKHLQPSGRPASNRMLENKDSLNNGMLDTPYLSMLSSATNLNSKDSSFSIPKQHLPFQKSSITEFGHVSSDCLLNPANESFTFMNCRNYGSSSSPNAVQEPDSQHPLRHFMDEWPKNQNDRSTMPWSELGLQSDRTQLSISIPMANDSTIEKTDLRLSRELDPIQMGLSVGGSVSDEQNGSGSLRQANWIPIIWDNSVGGPLGEVLHNTSNSKEVDIKNQSALNLMTDGWDNTSPRVVSSPTGVLQKIAFGSVSNSSAGSSPRTEIDPLGSTLPCIH